MIDRYSTDIFLDRFAHSGYFFFEPLQFHSAALTALPSGHPDRPSPALMSAVYLWGCVLFSPKSASPYPEDHFLPAALQSVASDISCISTHQKLILETIQTEVLLSLYYLHMGVAVEGRSHAATAASLALSAGLHQMGATTHASAPGFIVAAPLPPPQLDSSSTDYLQRVNAFWAAGRRRGVS